MTDTPPPKAAAPGSESDIWRSTCCNAPVVIVRSDSSVFDFCDQPESDELTKELEDLNVSEGSEFWMDDYVRVYHHLCAKCHKFVGEPWIEEILDSERRMRDMVGMIARMKPSQDGQDSAESINALIAQARAIVADTKGIQNNQTEGPAVSGPSNPIKTHE